MNPREAEKLLGGYATGTLSEAERKALFAAALEDQALFDALADEEALRALLADPAARAHLLAALEPAPKITPFWRRPAAMTLAASLLAAVGVGVLLKHTKAPEMRQVQKAAPAIVEEAPAAPSPRPSPQAPRQDKQLDQPKALAAPRVESAHAPEARLAMKRAPEPAPPPPPPPTAAAPAGALADMAPAAPAQEPWAAKPEAKVAGGAQVNGLASGGIQAPPVWTWEAVKNGHQLSVLWGPSGYLSLVAREPNGPRLVAPHSAERQTDGRIRSVFTLPGDSTPLDLFWLPYPATSFPEEGFLNGFRARVWPEKK